MTTARVPLEPVASARARTISGAWAMRLVITTEACFFAYLLFSYYYLWSLTPDWAIGGAPPMNISLPDTIILIVSSVTMASAERAIRRGRQVQLCVGLFATLVLGCAFLVLQSIEWSHQPFSITDNAYGSAFFTITGFHGAHVIVGLLMTLVVLIWALGGAFTSERHSFVTNAAWYWHFVDIVWICVFVSIYVIPRF